ncbi:MAG TPA: carboxypeptidase-like regulatory domain-containing protein [Acidobacteriaceae bacterium]|nr:carboxypeptidase-like regulatory domain-containing protein [Acidobacteriaceae bacterium]
MPFPEPPHIYSLSQTVIAHDHRRKLWKEAVLMGLLATVALFAALCCAPQFALSQTLQPPASAVATINGNVLDSDGDSISGAAVSITGQKSNYMSSLTADANGHFAFADLDTTDTYRLSITAPGFSEWDSQLIALQPGQDLDLREIKLKISAVETSVTAVSPEQMAAQQVKGEETQRVLGVVPSFFVVYDRNVVPMSPSMKFNLAIRAETDVVTFMGAATLAAIHQASDTPAYQQGLKGYGQRYGAAYAGGVSDILIGGAILPTLLHQDPRYFYDGEGTPRQRVGHALRSIFLTHGDNGKIEFNYSGLGGDMASAALSNTYYPTADRGAHLFLANWAVLSAGRAANTLAQEFLARLTTHHRTQ